MNSGPLVAVLTTTFKREKFFAESIDSVLASTFVNFELIIIDDCSTDETVHVGKNVQKKIQG